jgi:transcriptional regulator with XRE-family HTH domain
MAQGPFDSRGAALLRAWLAEDVKDRSQSGLARLLGTSQPMVSRWARGVLQPPIDVIAALERLIGIPCIAWAERIRARRRLAASA